MKNIKNFNYTVLAIITLFVIGCSKRDVSDVATLKTLDQNNSGYLKLISASTGSVRNYVFIDNAYNLLNGGALLSYATCVPAGSSYYSMKAGSRNLIIRDTATITTQPVLNFDHYFEPGKFYSLFTYDSAFTIKFKMVADPVVVVSDTTARLRFANFASGPLAASVDVFSKNLNANLFTNISVTSVSSFVPVATRLADSIFIRATGTTTNLVGTSVTPSQARNYTLLLSGRYEMSTGTVPRRLSLFTNY